MIGLLRSEDSTTSVPPPTFESGSKTLTSASSTTASGACLASSRTGAALPLNTTEALPRSSAPSASPYPLFSPVRGLAYKRPPLGAARNMLDIEDCALVPAISRSGSYQRASRQFVVARVPARRWEDPCANHSVNPQNASLRVNLETLVPVLPRQVSGNVFEHAVPSSR